MSESAKTWLCTHKVHARPIGNAQRHRFPIRTTKNRGHEVDIYADMSRTGSESMNEPWVGEDRPVIQCDLVTFFELMASGLRNDILWQICTS